MAAIPQQRTYESARTVWRSYRDGRTTTPHPADVDQRPVTKHCDPQPRPLQRRHPDGWTTAGTDRHLDTALRVQAVLASFHVEQHHAAGVEADLHVALGRLDVAEGLAAACRDRDAAAARARELAAQLLGIHDEDGDDARGETGAADDVDEPDVATPERQAC